MISWLSLLGVVLLALMYVAIELYPRFLGTSRDEKTLKASIYFGLDSKSVDTDPFEITPLPDFNWQETEPLKFRNFKPKYHLTMSITNTHLTELIEMDRNYLSRIQLRKKIISDHHETVIQASPAIKPAVDELYTWLVGTYLPTRFPSMFSLTPTSLLNHVTNEYLPLQPLEDSGRTFEILGENLDDDFLLLLKDEEKDSYVLKGFVTCFPAGFDTKEKFDMTLRDIHAPVPGYKAKLEKSMDRFFDKIEVGKVVKRSNWSITTHDRLFAASEHNHLYEGEEVVEEEVDIDNTYLRCERQLLHRLPNTKALVFNFKTYLYPIREIKEEESGPELADAIEGLKTGSVPQMWFYKRGIVWGEQVVEFLRG